MKLVLVVLHISFAALWFGGPLLATSMLKAAAPHGREPFLAAARLGDKGGAMAGIGTIGVLGTGLGLIFYVYEGFGGLPTNFHAALGLLILAMINGFGFLLPAAKRVVADAKQDDWTLEKARPYMKRLAMGGGINHLLWFSLLVLMYVRF